MAVVTRRYGLASPAALELKKRVAPSAQVVGMIGTCIDIQIDDSVGGAVETLDEFMTDRGYLFFEKDPKTQMGLMLKSPDGSTWILEVDDAGAISTRKL